MPLPPTQFLASRRLDQICDARVSISEADWCDTDDWGRAARSAPRFPTREHAERSLSALLAGASRLRLTAPLPPRSATPPSLTYPQPPRPPPHLQVDSSREVSLADIATPSAPLPPSMYPTVLTTAGSEPPSFGNLRDLSATSSRQRSPAPGARRPRTVPPLPVEEKSATERRAALADYVELNDEGLVERVFDDGDEPLSATGNGHVASVPQSPHNLLKRWMNKMNATAPNASSSTEEQHQPKVKATVLRETEPLYEKATEIEEQVHTVKQKAEPEAEPEREPASEQTLFGEAPVDLMVLKSDIPDRPRTVDPHQYLLEDVAYFDDPGDTALGEAYPGMDDLNEAVQEVHDPEDVAKPRPKLRQQMFTTIKSYHHTNLGFDEDEDYTSEEDTTVNSSTTDRSTSFGPRNKVVVRSDAVFEESHLSHSYDKLPRRTTPAVLSS